MKKLVLACVSAGLVLVSVSCVWAKGIFITPGPRASAMGGAFIGIADDATAIYWNPAGLSQLKGSGISVSGFYLANSAKSNTGMAISPAPDVANGDFPISSIYLAAEPSSFSSKEFKTSALIPFAAGYTRYNDVTIALGFYASGGGGGKYDGSAAAAGADTVNGSVDALQSFMVGNVSASKEVLPQLSVGLGLDVIYMTDNQKVTKSYTEGPGSPVGLMGLTDYRISLDNSATGTGFQVNAGALYRMRDNVRIGAVVRSGTEITLSGTSKYDQTGLAAAGSPDAHLRSNFDQHYEYPLTYGVGVAYDATDKLTLAAGIDRNNYSTMKSNVVYKSPIPGVFTSSDQKLDWSDTTQFRLGAAYRYNDTWTFLAGIQNDPAPFSQKNLTLLELNQYNMLYPSLGVGYSMKAFTINFAYAQGISDKPSVGTRSYEYPLNIFRLGVDYTF